MRSSGSRDPLAGQPDRGDEFDPMDVGRRKVASVASPKRRFLSRTPVNARQADPSGREIPSLRHVHVHSSRAAKPCQNPARIGWAYGGVGVVQAGRARPDERRPSTPPCSSSRHAGQCFTYPCLGCREFSYVISVDPNRGEPTNRFPNPENSVMLMTSTFRIRTTSSPCSFAQTWSTAPSTFPGRTRRK